MHTESHTGTHSHSGALPHPEGTLAHGVTHGVSFKHGGALGVAHGVALTHALLLLACVLRRTHATVGDSVAIGVAWLIARRAGENSQQYIYIYIWVAKVDEA